MNRLYALYRKLGKVSRRLKQTVTHPETWSRTLSGPAGRLRLLKTPPGPKETQVPGADQYSSIGINIGNAETITRGGSVQQSINETQRQVLGVDQYNSRIRSTHHKQILTTTVRQANRTWALSTYPAVSGILFPRLYISPLN